MVRTFASALGVKMSSPFELVPSLYNNLNPKSEMDLASAYAQVNTASVGIRRIMRDCASVPLVIARKPKSAGAVPTPLPDDAEPVRVFRKANPNEGGITLMQRFWLHLIRRGESFVEFEYLNARTPQELYIVPPEKCRARTDKDGIVREWMVKVPGGREERREANKQLMQVQFPSLDDEYRGQSDLRAALPHMQTERAAADHNLEYFKSGSRPPGVLETDQDLEQDQIERLRESWHRQQAGPGMMQRISVLFGGVKWRKTYESPKDADWVNGSKLTREQILSALGVPPALVGVFEYANYANSKEQKRLYWHNTIIPILQQVAQELTERAMPNWDPSGALLCYFDLSGVEALQEMRIDRATSLVSLVSGGIYTPNEAREELGKPRVVGGDTLRAPQTLSPIGSVVRPSTAQVRHYGDAHIRSMSDPVRKMRRKEVATKRDTLEGQSQRIAEGAMEDSRKRVLGRLHEYESKARVEQLRKRRFAIGLKALDIEDLWDDVVESDAMRDAVLRMYARIVSERGPAAAEDAGASPSVFLIDDPRVVKYIEDNAYAKGKLITGTNKDLLEQVIETWVNTGQTTGALTNAIEELFDLRHDEANRIARTETTSAYNFSTNVSWAQTGLVEGKGWLTAEDDAVRDVHEQADQQSVALDDSFLVGGETLAYPGDPAGSGWNIINCRCTIEPVFAGEALNPSTEGPQQIAYRISPKALDDLLNGNRLTGRGAPMDERRVSRNGNLAPAGAPE